jgi:uncharacterized membrane protein YtjA (UPF0391 family)
VRSDSAVNASCALAPLRAEKGFSCPKLLWIDKVGSPNCDKEPVMLYYAVVFLIIAIIAGFFGFFGVAGLAASIAKILFVIFIILFILSLIFGRRGRVP